MTHLGATTVLVPGGVLAYAFDKHQIDAAKFLTPAVDQRPYRTTSSSSISLAGTSPRRCSSFSSIMIGGMRLMISSRQCSRLRAGQSYLRPSPKVRVLKTAALEELAKDGVRVETWPDEIMKAFRRAWDEVAKEVRSPRRVFQNGA
jgi:hypothetical protein